LRLIALSALVMFLCATSTAQAYLLTSSKGKSLQERYISQTTNLKHARYVCHYGGGHHQWWSCKAIKWLTAERKKTWYKLHPVVRARTSYSGSVSYWAAKQISAAEVLGRESSGDPWPNCPDPYDGRGSWYDTLACENSGSWYDSAGYYRCGLQFDPMWERRFGKLCP